MLVAVPLAVSKLVLYSEVLFITTRRSHMVSRGYISAWADKNNVVDVLDLQHRRGYQTSITKASVESYVYDSEVITKDLETKYARIESTGISAIKKLRTDQTATRKDQDGVIAFLDMHLHRGRYADRANVRVPAALVLKDGTTKNAELRLGDMLALSEEHPETLRLTKLRLHNWPWHIHEVENLATGDGAVLLWRTTADEGITTVTFPLSPTQLLVIGDDLLKEPLKWMNLHIANNCRRWLVGLRDSLNIAGIRQDK